MSSYNNNFTYKGINNKDKNLIVVSFDPDNGFTDSFLSMDDVYTESWDGSKRYSYGARYNSVAEINITLIKKDESDFTVNDLRSCFRWLTGSKENSWLDLYDENDKLQYSFLGKVTNVQERKMDSRCVGIMLTFTSIAPWAFSPVIEINVNLKKDEIKIGPDGIVYIDQKMGKPFSVNDLGIVDSHLFEYEANGIVLINPGKFGSNVFNYTDELYNFVYLDLIFNNVSSTNLKFNNKTLNEMSIIKNVKPNEIITISSGQFIFSDNSMRIFGDDFNFIWPRLAPGENNIEILSDGIGSLKISYRYPIKIGDCAMDVRGAE